MPTNNPRVNITIEPPIMSVMTSLAKQQHKSISSVAKELILEALERREDMALSAIAESRDSKKEKTIPHDDAWK